MSSVSLILTKYPGYQGSTSNKEMVRDSVPLKSIQSLVINPSLILIFL